MKVIKNNRVVDGLEVQVYNPVTNRMLENGEVVDIDALHTYHDKYSFLQMVREGDLIEFVETKTTKEKTQ